VSGGRIVDELRRYNTVCGERRQGGQRLAGEVGGLRVGLERADYEAGNSERRLRQREHAFRRGCLTQRRREGSGFFYKTIFTRVNCFLLCAEIVLPALAKLVRVTRLAPTAASSRPQNVETVVRSAICALMLSSIRAASAAHDYVTRVSWKTSVSNNQCQPSSSCSHFATYDAR